MANGAANATKVGKAPIAASDWRDNATTERTTIKVNI